MAKKIEILNNGLIVTDTVSGLVEVSQPAKELWYNEVYLKNGKVKFESIRFLSESTEHELYPTFDLADAIDGADVSFTESAFRDFCLQNLGKSSAGGSALLTDHIGLVDYNDASTSTTPISLVANTWTDVPNDKLGAFTLESYLPDGVTTIIDPTTGYLDFSQLTLGSDVLIRFDAEVTPTINNALFEARYVLGTGAGEYPLDSFSKRLDSGSGIEYPTDKGTFYIYMGDNNTRNNAGKIQVRLSSAGTLVNAGIAIKIYKR